MTAPCSTGSDATFQGGRCLNTLRHVTNQADADEAIKFAGFAGYDLILIDLRYPLASDHVIDDPKR